MSFSDSNLSTLIINFTFEAISLSQFVMSVTKVSVRCRVPRRVQQYFLDSAKEVRVVPLFLMVVDYTNMDLVEKLRV